MSATPCKFLRVLVIAFYKRSDLTLLSGQNINNVPGFAAHTTCIRSCPLSASLPVLKPSMITSF